MPAPPDRTGISNTRSGLPEDLDNMLRTHRAAREELEKPIKPKLEIPHGRFAFTQFVAAAV
jgi:hypothetical protein